MVHVDTCMLHIKVRLPVLLCAVKTVVGDFQFCWTISPNVGQTHKENPNWVRIFYMIFTLNDIYKKYNKLHEHWYTKIRSLRCAEDRNPPQNASDLYMIYRSYAEQCRPCTHLSVVNWWKKKTLNCSYRIFIVCRSVQSFGPGFFCLNFGLTLFYTEYVHNFRGYWWYPLDITSIEIDCTSLVPLIYMPGTSGIYFVRLPNRLCSSLPLLGFYWNQWGETALPQASMPTIYKQHLYNMTTYKLKYRSGLGKTLFLVLGDKRTLCMLDH